MIGQTLGHYRVLEQIGAGGMGLVFRAHDERLERDVALKILPPGTLTDENARSRFRKEALTLSRLNHPNIETVFDFDTQDGVYFLVMELIPGVSLDDKLAVGALPEKEVVRLGMQLAEGLSAAHEQQVIHRDLKPGNLRLTPDGRLKILDFGVAKLIQPIAADAATESLSKTHGAVGTLPYMAPEQLEGAPADVRSDIWSAGAVLYELATGKRPFPQSSAPMLTDAILRQATVPPRAVNASLSPELERIIAKSLEKNPEHRYQSAAELKADLSRPKHDLALPTAVAGKRAVAVLPFKLLTPNFEDEYLSVALADAVINQLGASGELLVRPTSTVLRYAKQSQDPISAARELNVQVVVDGSIQKCGQQLRVHVQAWDVNDGSTLASAKHDSELAGLFALQDEIAGTIAKALGSKAPRSSSQKEEPPTTNPMAYELYLRGVDRLMRLNRWDTRTSIEILENAVVLDPRFADAWARLGEACVLMAGTFEPGPLWVHRAERAVRKALALDRLNAEAHVARGRLVWTPAKKFQHRTALRALGDALRYSPGTHQALVWRGCILVHIGLMEEAKENLIAALASNPDDGFTLGFLATAYEYLGEYEETDQYRERILMIDRANLWGNLFAPVSPLYRSDLDRAERCIRSGQQVLPNDPMLLACEALLWAKRGERKKAEPLLARALRSSPSMLHTHHMIHMAAATNAVLGQKKKAIALLRKSAFSGLPNYPMFVNDPHFLALHREPSFMKLMAELRKEWTHYVREFGTKTTSRTQRF